MNYRDRKGKEMETIKKFKKGDRVYLEYEIDGMFINEDKIYYTLRNPSNGTYLKGLAFTQ